MAETSLESAAAYTTKEAIIDDLMDIRDRAESQGAIGVGKELLHMAWKLSNTNTNTGISDDIVTLSAGNDEAS